MLLINTVGMVNGNKKFHSHGMIDQLTKKNSFLVTMNRNKK
jgi:hypothetical protein